MKTRTVFRTQQHLDNKFERKLMETKHLQDIYGNLLKWGQRPCIKVSTAFSYITRTVDLMRDEVPKLARVCW